MVKPEVFYVLLYVAILLLLALSNSPQATDRHRRRGNRRLAHVPHHRFHFDSKINQLERTATEKGLLDLQTFQEKLDKAIAGGNSREFPEDIGVLEDYFGEEGRLNLTERLMYLFSLLDRFPKDGVVSFDELEKWNHRQAMDQLAYNADLRMKELDKDRDGHITLLEFLRTKSYDEIDLKDMRESKGGWWKERFENADEDQNTVLDATEFRNFLHPEDSRRPQLEMWLQKEMIRKMDQNEDGKLSYEEFLILAEIYYKSFEADDVLEAEVDNAEELFKELDVNNDKFVRAEELNPIIHKLYPGEFLRATRFTGFLMNAADGDRDGKLTLEEMLNHKYAFYSTVMEEGRYDEDEYYIDDNILHVEL